MRFAWQMGLTDSAPGLFARIVAHRWFERIALLLTLSNVIYISLDVEFNYSGLVTRHPVGFIVADNIFLRIVPLRTIDSISVIFRETCSLQRYGISLRCPFGSHDDAGVVVHAFAGSHDSW